MLSEPARWIRALLGVESGQAVVVAALQIVGHAEGLVLLDSLRVAVSLLIFPNGLEDAFGVRINNKWHFLLVFKILKHYLAVPDVGHFRPAGIHLRAANFVMCQFGLGPKVVETPFAQEFLLAKFRNLCPDECRHVFNPYIVETERFCRDIVAVEFLPVFVHVIILDEKKVHMPGFFRLAHVVWKNVEDILPLFQNVDVDSNVRIESFKFWRVFWLERKSSPLQLTLFSCSTHLVFW